MRALVSRGFDRSDGFPMLFHHESSGTFYRFDSEARSDCRSPSRCSSSKPSVTFWEGFGGLQRSCGMSKPGHLSMCTVSWPLVM